MESKKNNTGLIISLVLSIIVIIGLVTFIVMKKDVLFNSNETKVEQKENDDNKISAETKKELLDMIGLDEKGIHRNEDDENVVILSDYYSIPKRFIDLNGEEIINGKNDYFIEVLVESYARSHNLVEECVVDNINNPDIAPKAGSSCYDGLSTENYKKIAKKYNLPEDGINYFLNGRYHSDIGIYNNYYLMYPEATLSSSYKIIDNLSYETDEKDIIINYDVKLDEFNVNMDILELSEDDFEHLDKTLKFLFKQYDDGTYYLYSVYVKDNIQSNKEISEETKKELLNMVGIDVEGYPISIEYANSGYSKVFVKKENDKVIGKINGLLEFFMVYSEKNKEDIISKYDVPKVTYLLWFAAVQNDLLVDGILNVDDNPDYVTAGATGRDGIKFDDYRKVAKKYNLPDDGDIIFNDKYYKYNNYYVLDREYSLEPYYQIESNVDFEYSGNNIIVYYNLKANEIDNDRYIDTSMKFTFKQYGDGTYYLYSVYVKNNK